MKRILSVVLALMMCLSLCACGKQPVEAPTEPATQPPTQAPTAAPTEPATEPPTEAPTEPAVPEVIPGSATAIFKDEGENPVLEMRVTLPACQGLPQIDGYYKAIYDDLYATCGLSREDAILQKQDLGDVFRPWAMEMTHEVLRNDGNVLSILRELYENRNSAHPSLIYFAETFEVASQGRLLLGDLFTVSEDVYLSRLRDLILAQMDQKETESGVFYFDFAREQLMTLHDPMDFALTDDSLLIFFDEYALAPYAAGLQHFYLPLSDLADILNPLYFAE